MIGESSIFDHKVLLDFKLVKESMSLYPTLTNEIYPMDYFLPDVCFFRDGQQPIE